MYVFENFKKKLKENEMSTKKNSEKGNFHLILSKFGGKRAKKWKSLYAPARGRLDGRTIVKIRRNGFLSNFLSSMALLN